MWMVVALGGISWPYDSRLRSGCRWGLAVVIHVGKLRKRNIGSYYSRKGLVPSTIPRCCSGQASQTRPNPRLSRFCVRGYASASALLFRRRPPVPLLCDLQRTRNRRPAACADRGGPRPGVLRGHPVTHWKTIPRFGRVEGSKTYMSRSRGEFVNG